MNTVLSKIISKQSNIGDHAMAFSNQVIFWGNEGINDDMMLIGKVKYSPKTPELFYQRKSIHIQQKELLSLYEKVIALTTTSAYAMFLLNAEDIKMIKQGINKLDATHIRLFSTNGQVKLSIFDYRNFVDSLRASRKKSYKIYSLDIDTDVSNDFSHTFNASSFAKVPYQDLFVRIGTNGLCELNLVKDELKYFFRDQQIKEPITTFYSNQVGQDVSLALY